MCMGPIYNYFLLHVTNDYNFLFFVWQKAKEVQVHFEWILNNEYIVVRCAVSVYVS